ncbi:hypothetical protein [Nonlabens sp.]|uniref:hypothetical protein n=1 Tax=Nonlabens sp. TaxID=1888209 RepID=UPI003F696307
MRKLVFAALAGVFMWSSGFLSIDRNDILSIEDTFELCACHSINFYYDAQGAYELFSESVDFNSFVWDDLTCKTSELNQRPKASIID